MYPFIRGVSANRSFQLLADYHNPCIAAYFQLLYHLTKSLIFLLPFLAIHEAYIVLNEVSVDDLDNRYTIILCGVFVLWQLYTSRVFGNVLLQRFPLISGSSGSSGGSASDDPTAALPGAYTRKHRQALQSFSNPAPSFLSFSASARSYSLPSGKNLAGVFITLAFLYMMFKLGEGRLVYMQ
jgi:hypothetical protein